MSGTDANAVARAVRIEPPGLEGMLDLPAGCRSVVVFAHGSGSSRLSPRNNAVAQELREAGLGTFLFDLLTDAEAADRANVFDIPLLADRLSLAAGWLREKEGLARWRFGYFGASTGAAAALTAAALTDSEVGAVVSRGGRPDLAMASLPAVRAPTLLIVGGADDVVLALNRKAYSRLRCEKALEIVPGAGHLFEEPDTFAAMTELARDWFARHLGD
ncbi:MAG: alpha/beta hydrolase [Inquilinus sp.]|nr:alpha/beta hydrolase [Inquilinus sp.]